MQETIIITKMFARQQSDNKQPFFSAIRGGPGENKPGQLGGQCADFLDLEDLGFLCF